jgi:hypothetical protein
MENPEQGPRQEYDKEAWERIKASSGGSFSAIEMGRKMGVDEDEIRRTAVQRIERAIADGDEGFIARFSASTGIGTAEERAVWSARAEDTERRRKEAAPPVVATSKPERKEREKAVEIRIPATATVAELFAAIREEEQDERLMLELHDNFDAEIVEQLTDLANGPSAGTVGVLEFFDYYGYSRDEIETFLPVVFTE